MVDTAQNCRLNKTKLHKDLYIQFQIHLKQYCVLFLWTYEDLSVSMEMIVAQAEMKKGE